MKPGVAIVAVVIGVLLLACDRSFTQKVTAKLSQDGQPLAGTSLRLYAEAQCQGKYLESVSSHAGLAQWSRPAEIGGIAVVTDELSLCIAGPAGWTQLYWSLHGPAPRSIELDCDLARSPAKACVAKMDGVVHDA
jgi:hypothetical protein